MSAFIVSKRHIDAMVQAGQHTRDIQRLRWYHNGVSNVLTFENVDKVGRILWLENLASVAYLYPNDGSGERPGPNGLTDDAIADYTYTPATRSDEKHTPVQVLKLIHSYIYQSCEHPGWETSEAAAIVQALQKQLITRLAGYEDAPWAI